MTLRIELDRDECLSSGKCVADYPSAFDFDDEELAMVTPGAQSISDEDKLRAARNCPSRAILLFEESGSQIEA
jgi:ferredoxin